MHDVIPDESNATTVEECELLVLFFISFFFHFDEIGGADFA